MMILVNAFMVYTLKNRRHITPWHKKYGPLMLTIAAAPLILADIFRHLLNDYDVWDLSEYGNGNAENVTNLTVWGWLFTIVFTYSGFICLFVGVMWNASILTKLKVIRQRWRDLQAARRGQVV